MSAGCLPEPKPLYRWTLSIPLGLAEEARGFLLPFCHGGWEEEELEDCLNLRLYMAREEDALDLGRKVGGLFPQAAVIIDSIPDRDWAKSWREFFTPVLIGETFAVIPPWMMDENPYKNRHRLVIEPATAFGTGHHATTAMCLEALADLFHNGIICPGQRFLDLGTGTGILGISLVKLGLHGLGVDIDPLAIQNSVENKALNLVSDEFLLRECSVSGLGEERYHCIVANILSGPLVDMAVDIVRLLSPGGALVLSGILSIQAHEVQAAYMRLGLPEPRRYDLEEWSALVFLAPEE